MRDQGNMVGELLPGFFGKPLAGDELEVAIINSVQFRHRKYGGKSARVTAVKFDKAFFGKNFALQHFANAFAPIVKISGDNKRLGRVEIFLNVLAEGSGLGFSLGLDEPQVHTDGVHRFARRRGMKASVQKTAVRILKLTHINVNLKVYRKAADNGIAVVSGGVNRVATVAHVGE